jgi:hypothetical protein
MKMLLLITLALVSRAALAADFDCQSLWSEKLFPGQPNSFQCVETFSSGGQKIYRYRDGWTGAADEQAVVNQMQVALTDSIAKYSGFGKIPAMTLIYTGLESEDGPEVMATTYGQLLNATHSCPVLVFKGIKKYKMTEAFRKQTIAHEVFHCFQAANYREHMFGPGGNVVPLNKEYTGWWVEGTAEYFSNVVYPTANQEFEKMASYFQDSIIVEEDPYSTEAFFQSYANNNPAGVLGVLNLIKLLPKDGVKVDQLNALSKTPGIGRDFHTFAKEFANELIADAGGEFLPTKFVENYHVTPVPPSNEDFKMKVKPFTIKTMDLAFAKGGRYTVTLMPVQSSTGIMLSYREKKLGSTVWVPAMPGAPMEFNTSCYDQDREYDFLMTSTAEGYPEQELTLKVEYTDVPCLCNDQVKFDSCLVGNWELDNSTLDSLLKDTVGSGNNYLGSDHVLYLEITNSKDFYLDMAGLSYIFELLDPHGPYSRVRTAFYGSSHSKIGSLDSQTVCLKNTSGIFQIFTSVSLAGGVVHSDAPWVPSDSALTYACSGKVLTLKVHINGREISVNLLKK